MAVDARRPSRPRLPPLPQRVTAEITCTDPGLSLVVDALGRTHVRGVSRGVEGAGGALTVAFDGARISACVRPGTSAAGAVSLLEKALPQGYRLAMGDGGDGAVVLEIIRSPNAPAPPRAEQDGADELQILTADAFVG